MRSAAVLKRRSDHRADPTWVFSHEAGSHVFLRAKKAAARLRPGLRIMGEDGAPGPIDAFTTHDFRRTFSTYLAALGTDKHIIDRLTNHAPAGMTTVAAIYNRHTYADEKRAAMTT